MKSIVRIIEYLKTYIFKRITIIIKQTIHNTSRNDIDL